MACIEWNSPTVFKNIDTNISEEQDSFKMTQMENFSLNFNILNYTFFSKQVYELYKLLKDNLGLQNSQINQQEFLKK